MLADNPAFQGLLKEEEAVYPDITAELPRVPLEEEVVDHRAVMDKDEPNFRVLAARALDNANINPGAHLRAARVAEAQPVAPDPILIDANEDEIIYKLMFDLPLHPPLHLMAWPRCPTTRPMLILLSLRMPSLPPNVDTHYNLAGVRLVTNPTMNTLPARPSFSWEKQELTGVLSNQENLSE